MMGRCWLPRGKERNSAAYLVMALPSTPAAPVTMATCYKGRRWCFRPRVRWPRSRSVMCPLLRSSLIAHRLRTWAGPGDDAMLPVSVAVVKQVVSAVVTAFLLS